MMTNSIELKKCPFCGGEAKLNDVDHGILFFVSCKNCGAATFAANKSSIAEKSWNRRAEPEISRCRDNEEAIMRLEEKLRKYEYDRFVHQLELDMIEAQKKQIDELAEHMKKYGTPCIYGGCGGCKND